MELKFDVSARIGRPVDEVFEAVVNPDELSKYFTTAGAKGRLETGATVYWEFKEHPGSFPVTVVEVEKNRRIIFQWESSVPGREELGTYITTVTMRFEPLENNRTLISIAEEGWDETPGGLQMSYNNCGGWAQMLCHMKAHLDHGINLREGMYT